MRLTPRRIAFHVVIFVVVFVVLTGVAIWLGLGPAAHSQTAWRPESQTDHYQMPPERDVRRVYTL